MDRRNQDARQLQRIPMQKEALKLKAEAIVKKVELN